MRATRMPGAISGGERLQAAGRHGNRQLRDDLVTRGKAQAPARRVGRERTMDRRDACGTSCGDRSTRHVPGLSASLSEAHRLLQLAWRTRPAVFGASRDIGVPLRTAGRRRPVAVPLDATVTGSWCRDPEVGCGKRGSLPGRPGCPSSDAEPIFPSFRSDAGARVGSAAGSFQRKKGAAGAAPLECVAGPARARPLPSVAYGWTSAPKAPRISPRSVPWPNALPVRLQVPMRPSGPSWS